MSFDEAVYIDLREIGCCNRCCLRFMGDKSANFEDPDQYIQDLLVISKENFTSKKSRPNPCSACLGVLESNFVDELLNHSCWTELAIYESDDYRINLSTPASISIRNKAVTLYLKQKYPDFYALHGLDENTLAIHVVFKLAFKMKLDQHCKKSYNVHSGLQLWTELSYQENDKEVQVMYELDPSFFRNRRHRGGNMFSKNAITSTLSNVNDKTFAKHCTIPPEIPTNSVHIESVKFESLPLYFAGRYCKYSRKLYQTPWNVENDDGNCSSTCVQDIIFNGLNEVFGFSKYKMTFSSSGREDVDVRCLGSGRPFYVKIESFKKSFPVEMFRKLEEIVNESPDVAIFDMQLSDRNAISNVKQGEEMKMKSYLALCLIRDSKNPDEIIEKINEIGRNIVNIEQSSPVRVLHRRVATIRQKRIFRMSAHKIPGLENLFQLFLEVQAGTYIKEFIHGDFGRTSPCISDLVQANVDIFKLDVIGIDLDWPRRINSTPYPLLAQIKELKDDGKVENIE